MLSPWLTIQPSAREPRASRVDCSTASLWRATRCTPVAASVSSGSVRHCSATPARFALPSALRSEIWRALVAEVPFVDVLDSLGVPTDARVSNDYGG